MITSPSAPVKLTFPLPGYNVQVTFKILPPYAVYASPLTIPVLLLISLMVMLYLLAPKYASTSPVSITILLFLS